MRREELFITVWSALLLSAACGAVTLRTLRRVDARRCDKERLVSWNLVAMGASLVAALVFAIGSFK